MMLSEVKDGLKIEIFLTNLGKYVEGELVGKWVTLPCDIDEEMKAIGIGSPRPDGGVYEEWFITDDDSPIGVSIGEYANIRKLNEFAERIEELRDDEKDALKHILATGEFGSSRDLEDAFEVLENHEFTIYTDCDDMSDVAYHTLNENGTVDMVRDMLLEQENKNNFYSKVPYEHSLANLMISNFNYDSYGRTIEITGKFYKVDYSTFIELHR